MKSIILTTVFICVIGLASSALECSYKELDIPKDWIDMEKACVKKMRAQVEDELKAAMQYMAMGAHFSKDTVNRPGFAEIFFKSASEEREHAIKLISYLLMRGELTSKVSSLIKRNLMPSQTTWTNGVSALKDALKLEASVTRKIRDVIKVCEEAKSFNDYHLVDYLSGDFLGEQYQGQRDIAGKISTLEKMTEKHGALGEWLFDKKLLKGEL
nr:ferritin subunit-like [Leptinotarsa decemlineata]